MLIVVLFLLVFCGIPAFAQDVRLQLVEPFEFVGSQNYDPAFDYQTNGTTVGEACLAKLQSGLEKAYPGMVSARLGNQSVETINLKQQFVYVRGTLSRVERTQVLKGGAVLNINLSVTCGLEFLDLATGESYYNRMRTLQTVIQKPKDSPPDPIQLQQSYRVAIDEILDSLVTQASQAYIPGSLVAMIVDKEAKTWILNQGANAGFVPGVNVRVQDSRIRLRIVDGNEDLSLAELSSGPDSVAIGNAVVKVGNTLTKGNAARTLVMPLDAVISALFDPTLPFDPAAAGQWFRDYFGSLGKLNLVPIPGALMATQVWAGRRGTVAEQNLIGNLVRPDYLAYPRLLYAYTVVEEGPRGSMATLRVGVDVQIVDRLSGTILFSSRRDESRSEAMAEGLRELNIADEFPSVLKGAIFELSKQVGEQFTTSIATGTVSNVDNSVITLDQSKDLRGGQILPLYRALRNVKDPQTGKLVGTVERRIGLVRTVEDKTGNMIAVPVSLQGTVRKGDRIRGFSTPRFVTPATISVDSLKATSVAADVVLSEELLHGAVQRSLSKASKLTPVVSYERASEISSFNGEFERGAYKVQGQTDEFNLPPARYSASVTVNVLEISRPNATSALLRLGVDMEVMSIGSDSVVFKDSLKLRRELKGKASSKTMVVGLSERDLQVNLVDMSEIIFDELFKRLSEKT